MPLSLLQYTRDTSPKLTTKTVELGHALPVQRSRCVTKDRVKRARSTATSSACHVHPSERKCKSRSYEILRKGCLPEMELAPLRLGEGPIRVSALPGM